MAAKTKGPTQKAVDELVTSYLIDSVRQHAGEDEELLDRVLALHQMAVEREAAHDPAQRIGELKQNPLIRGAVAAMGERVQRLVDTGVAVAQDTQDLRVRLRERLTERGLDPANASDYPECVLEYERVLAETIPLKKALGNVDAVADLVDLANDVLNPGSGLKRNLYEMAWRTFRKVIFKDPHVLDQMESLKREVEADPERLKRISALIRDLGPGIVEEAYERAEETPTPGAGAAPAKKAPASRKAPAGAAKPKSRPAAPRKKS